MDETGKAIREAFMDMYARERMDRITVKALCAAVPVARTTFYARYRNVDGVLEEVEDGLLAGLAEVTERISGGNLPQMEFRPFLDETFAFIEQNWSCFHALLIEQPDNRFISKWREAIKANFGRRYPTVRMQPNWELLAEVAASAAIGAYTYWMKHPDMAGIEDAKQLIDCALTNVMECV